MLTVVSIPLFRQRHKVVGESPVCSMNLSSDIIGSGSGGFIPGRIESSTQLAAKIVSRMPVDPYCWHGHES